MIRKLDDLTPGYHEICNRTDIHPEMLMEIGVQVMEQGETLVVYDQENETALLLLTGKINFQWQDQTAEATRNSVFDENPAALHVPCDTRVTVTALEDSQILIQKTDNIACFPAKFYAQEDCTTEIFGENVWNDTARRAVRTVFNYKNAPYSNMVVGEVINFPGKWSSYIPHGHAQPEVYYYRFQRPEGFGAAFIGDDVYKIVDNSALMIPGGPSHPQAAAPGYPMFYVWMIRHLPGDPWTSRVNDERYTWLLDKDVKIWPEK